MLLKMIYVGGLVLTVMYFRTWKKFFYVTIKPCMYGKPKCPKVSIYGIP